MHSITKIFIRSAYLLILSMVLLPSLSDAQDTTSKSNSVPVEDLGTFARRILNKKEDTAKAKKKSNLAILPSVGYNPSLGFLIGAKVSGLKQLGDPADTRLSSFGLEALITSKGVITVQARHNVFTSGNKWNIQGNWQFSKFLVADYNVGTGNADYITKSDSVFPIKFNVIRFTEGAYRRIGKHFYVGVGVTFNLRTKIDDEKLDSLGSTPHQRYSLRNGFDTIKYFSNGLAFGIEYNTRDHPLRSYSGTYVEAVLRVNPEWLGSSQKSVQFYYDLRKYIGLSKKNPEHVLAFWFIGSFKLNGKIPYLDLPATGSDMYGRSGRAYTISRFKGPSYTFYESEWRFPITRNKLLSGVAFFNLQTASDDLGKKVFDYWEPGGGAGLRVLLKKEGRATLCLDYARGKYNSSGLFFGLNEVF